MITRRYPVWISPLFLCLIANGRMFFYSSKALALFTIDTTLTTYMPTYVAPLMPKTAGTYVGGVMGLISFSLIFCRFFGI